jgi:hypothetical protein
MSAYKTKRTSVALSDETRELLRLVQEQLSLSTRQPIGADVAVLTLIWRWPDRAFTIKGEEHATQDR